jgi:hypothetical protein
MHPESIRYSRGQLSAEQLEKEINEFWIESKSSSKLQTELTSAGLDDKMLEHEDIYRSIAVRVGSSGVDPTSVSLIIAFAPTVNRIMKDVWTTIILPRIQRRWGDDAVGRELKNDD